MICAFVEYLGAIGMIRIVRKIIRLAIFLCEGPADPVLRWAHRIEWFLLIAWMRVFADVRLVYRWRCSCQ